MNDKPIQVLLCAGDWGSLSEGRLAADALTDVDLRALSVGWNRGGEGSHEVHP